MRIGPNELHCNDPAFIDEIYASSGRKRNKQAHYLGVLVGLTRKTSFGTIDHDLHRLRRNAMNKFFSRTQITKLEPEMKKLTQLLCDKLLSTCAVFSSRPRLSTAANQVLTRPDLSATSIRPEKTDGIALNVITDHMCCGALFWMKKQIH